MRVFFTGVLIVMRGGGWARAVRVVGVVVLLCVAWLQLALPPLPHDPQSALGGSARETPEFDTALRFQRNPTSKFLQVCFIIKFCHCDYVSDILHPTV